MWKFAAFPIYDFYLFIFVLEVWSVGWTKQSAVKASLQALGNFDDISHNFQNIYKPNDQSIHGKKDRLIQNQTSTTVMCWFYTDTE